MSVKIGDYGLSHSRYKVSYLSSGSATVFSDCFHLYCPVKYTVVFVTVALQDDYYITQDQIWVPLRWIAPELIDEVHGNLLVVDQTKSSNIW